MTQQRRGFYLAVLLLAALNLSAQASDISENSISGDFTRIFVSGRILDQQGRAVADAMISLRINDKVVGHTQSSINGIYLLETSAPSGLAAASQIEMTIRRASFRDVQFELAVGDFNRADADFYLLKNASLTRKPGPSFWMAALVLAGVYALIAFDVLNRTVVAMLGASVMLAISYTAGTLYPEYRMMSFETAMQMMDLNVIFLLMGMMIIAGMLKQTGVFHWVAYKCFQLARGSVMMLSIILMFFAAVASAFIDNVTTMVLLTPIFIEIAQTLRISPTVLLLPAVLAANIGGTATLIGGPPNIMIGSYTGFPFIAFLKNLGPVAAISLIMLFIFNRFYHGRIYRQADSSQIDAILKELHDKYRITDRVLLGFGLFILGLVIFLFMSHQYWGMEVSIAALAGASIFFTIGLVTKKVKLRLLEKEIDWRTLLFFMFLFILVGCAEENGLLSLVSDGIANLSKGNLTLAVILVLWVSAIMSALVDNIPFTATMLPVVAYLSSEVPGAESGVLWWALALGACFGGNGTMIGASANVAAIGIAEEAGHHIKFFQFAKFGFVYMLVSVAIANLWLLIFLS